MKIDQFDKNNLQLLRSEIDLALKLIGCRYGIKLSTGTCRFLPKSATFNLELMTVDDSGNAITREAQILRDNLGLLGLRESHLNQKFLLSGKTVQIIGYNPRKYSKPFLLKCLNDGKTYSASKDSIKRGLGLPTVVSR